MKKTISILFKIEIAIFQRSKNVMFWTLVICFEQIVVFKLAFRLKYLKLKCHFCFNFTYKVKATCNQQAFPLIIFNKAYTIID